MRSFTLLLSCLLSSIPLLAATPQYSARQDTATGFQKLTGLAVADFNGDGRPDVAVTDVYSKRVVVYLTTATGTLSSPISTSLQFPAVSTGGLVVGDFNEDGKQDLILSTVGGSQQDILLTGNGDGTFTQQAALSGSFGFTSAMVADLNHDKHLDLIAGGNGSLYVHLGDGHGGFTLQALANQGTSDLFTAVAAADFNSDSNVDFVAAGYITNSLRYFSGNGNGTFATPSNLATTIIFSPSTVVSADFNGDGKPDLLVGSANIDTIIFGNGDGTFQTNKSQIFSPPTPVPPGTSTMTTPPLVASGDMDGDGKQDVVVLDALTNTVNVDINDGTGRFLQVSPDFSAAIQAGSGNVALADLNGDGLPDIIITNYLTQNISVFLSIKPKIAPAVTLTASANQQLVGTSLAFTVKVSGNANTAGKGSVTLLDGPTTLGQQTLDANGQTTFTISNLSAAPHSLSVTFPGDNNYLAATATLSENVTDFQIALPAPSQAVNRGTAATYVVNLTPIANFSGTVTFTCAGLPGTSSCQAASVSLSGQPASVSLTVTTTPASSSSRSGVTASGFAGSIALGLLAVLSAALLPRKYRFARLSGLLMVIAGLQALSGCGSSSQSNISSPGSPSGSTAFTVTASTSQGSTTVSHQVSATLVVN